LEFRSRQVKGVEYRSLRSQKKQGSSELRISQAEAGLFSSGDFWAVARGEQIDLVAVFPE
jgi:hypothetical protein